MKSDSTDRTNKKRRPAKRTAASLSGQSLSRRRYRKDSNSRGDFDVDHDPKVGLSVYPPIAARRKPCRGLRCWPPPNELTVVHGFIGPLSASRTASSGPHVASRSPNPPALMGTKVSGGSGRRLRLPPTVRHALA
jgi:hypothetical protein